MIIVGDCVEVLEALVPEESVDAVVTDPPYGLEFMGNAWDKLDGGGAGMAKVGLGGRATPWPTFGAGKFGGANPTCAACGGRLRGAKTCGCPSPDWRIGGKPLPVGAPTVGQQMQSTHTQWLTQAHTTLKPDGYVDSFGGTRTFHRLAAAMVEAGFGEPALRAWCYGSGFVKNHNVSKAIDKAAGVPRTKQGSGGAPTRLALGRGGSSGKAPSGIQRDYTPDSTHRTPEAAQWEGYGTALTPAWEPILRAHPHGVPAAPTGLRVVHLLRKPLDGTIAEAVLEHGTAALNIDGCRMATGAEALPERKAGFNDSAVYGSGPEGFQYKPATGGRWPKNMLLVHAPGCTPTGTAEVKGGSGADTMTPTTHEGAAKFGYSPERRQFNYGTETVQQWACVEGCPAAALGAQTGVTKGSGCVQSTGDFGKNGVYSSAKGAETLNYADKGTAARFFWQGRSSAIANYLYKLLAPLPAADFMPPGSRESTVVYYLASEEETLLCFPFDAADNRLHAVLIQAERPETLARAFKALKPGGHLALFAPDHTPTGWRGACVAEDAGFEVRDAILIAEPGAGDAFRYVAKAPKKEKEAGTTPAEGADRGNIHPTVKPVAIMRWLVGQAPSGGTILEPFLGSGTTAIAAMVAGRKFIAVEREPDYAAIAQARIDWAAAELAAGRTPHQKPPKKPRKKKPARKAPAGATT